MKQFPHAPRPILMWALLSSAIFFAVAWLLGSLFKIESVHQISKISFCISALAFLITNPLKPFCWAFRTLDRLYHARPLSSLLNDERQAVVWSLFIAEAVCVSTYLLAKTLESDALRFVATVAFLVVSPVVVILSLPLVFRCSVRAIVWLFGSVWCSLLFLWRCYRWLNFRRIIYLSLGFCGLVLLCYAEEDFRGWLAWQRFKHEWEAKGERFDYASIIPRPVPDDQNFALTPIVASCYESELTKYGRRITRYRTNVVNRMWMRTFGNYRGADWPWPTNLANWELGKPTDLKELQLYYRALAAKTNQFPVPAVPQSPAADVLLALSTFDSDIEELRKASALAYSRFPLNYSDMEHDTTNPPVVMLMHLSPIQSCVQVLNLRAIAELENGQSGKALDDVKLALRLVDATRIEPSAFSHNLRARELNTIFQPIWEGLAKHKWSDTQLAAIELELGKLDFLADSQLAMRGERDEQFARLDYYRRVRPYPEFRQMFAPLMSLMSPGPDELRRLEREKTFGATVMCLIPSGWFYQDKLVIGKTYQQCSLRTTDPAKHLAFPDVAQYGAKIAGSLPRRPWNVFARYMAGWVGSENLRLIYAQETTDLARVGCALERFRLAHDDYPAALEMLVPRLIENIPHDIIGGKPLHYGRTADGRYLLYSVGWNEVDDGGKLGLQGSSSGYLNLRLGDWIWPCP
jgi:hypothetical protein